MKRRFYIDYRRGKAKDIGEFTADARAIIECVGSLPEARAEFERIYGKWPIIGIGTLD